MANQYTDLTEPLFTKADLAKEVQSLLHLPYPRYLWDSGSYQVINTIFNTMAKALQRGEAVRIRGFGAFVPYTKPAVKCYIEYFHKQKGLHRELRTFPAKRRVKFIPYKPLKRMVYGESDNE